MIEKRETPEEIAARVRETLPGFLKRSNEEIEADKAAMRLRVASFTRSKLTPEERDISRGAQIESIARANLESQEALRAEGHKVSTRGGANLEMIEQETIRLAEGLELQGRFREAAGIHPKKREKERLFAIEEAIARPDDEFCGCPADEKEVQGRKFEAHPHYEVKRIYSRRHGKSVSLVKCRKCGSLNATPTPPPPLAQILSAVAGSHGAAQAQERLRRSRR
jgi:hypothetical protein